jgi:hypothetical protein
MRNFLLFVAGVVFGALLFNSPAAQAANQLMFGSFSGAAKAVAVDTNGNVLVQLN